MKKNSKLEDFNEQELTEYLAENSEEDLKADETTLEDGFNVDDLDEFRKKDALAKVQPEEDEDTKAKVIDEVEFLPEAERKRIQKAEAKMSKKLQKEQYKKIKAHRKDLRKNPSILKRYDVDPEFGLPTEIVEQRIIDERVNKTNDKKTKSVGKIIAGNVISFFNFLVFALAAILIIVAITYKRFEPITDLSFLLIVLININIGIIQEIRAKKTIESLSLMNESSVNVRRNGIVKEIRTDEVVLDDIILLESGKQICADSIVMAGQIEVNESLLTGESDSIIKKPGDQLLSGSFVISGKCDAKVDKVGKDNYIEQLSSQAKMYKKPKSDLLISLNRIIKFMFIPVIIFGLLLFLRMYFNQEVSLFNNIRRTSGAMVGMIPSGLFLMSSIALYVGVIRLGQKNVLVQDLYCIEMLARVNCICLDKTGTITDGTMVVKNVIDYEQIAGLATKNIVSAILNALPDRNMTSDALINKFGLSKRMKFTGTIPFSSQRKFQAVTFDKYGTFALGAPEFVLGDVYKSVSKDVEKYAKLGYRVLCLAYVPGYIENNELPEGEMTVVSMILIEDNIRQNAISTIQYFKESGVEVKVISGDNPITVSKIAERAGVPNAINYISLEGMDDNEVARAALKYTVFGRVSPNQKRIIVMALQHADKCVAMTGDGVNDILALRAADCSIALGSGSDATRSCSHLVLLDSDFGSMPSVVAEGRRVINNVTSVASLFLTKTIFSLLLAIVAIFTGVYPITPKQLIIIDILAIGIPSLILVNEPNNNTFSGRFLSNVIKKALPGALVITMLSSLIFILADMLHLDDKSLTTIIVITASHTCLMVLFKACHPFNMIRKILFTTCYSVFLIMVIMLPNLLEFRPLLSLFDYYSDNQEFTYMKEFPEISISTANYFVIDGKITNIRADGDKKVLTRLSKSKDPNKDASVINYYAINGEETDLLITMPTISYDNKGNIFAGGYLIDGVSYYDGIEDDLIVDSHGKVYISDYNYPVYTTLVKDNDYYNYKMNYGTYVENDARRQYSILPKVEIENNRYIFNGVVDDDGYYPVSSSISQIFTGDSTQITINPETLELLINGDPVKKVMNNGSEGYTYRVSMPVISTTGNVRTAGVSPRRLYFDAVPSGRNIFELYGAKEKVDDYVNMRDSYAYTIYTLDKDDNKVYYTYFEAYDFVFKNVYDYLPSNVAAGNPDLDDIQLGEYLDYEFKFEKFYEDDFKGFYDRNNNEINVNSGVTPLSFKVDMDKSEYSLTHVIDSGEYLDDGDTKISLNEKQFAPTISVSDDLHYVIGGYYTDYEHSIGKELVETYYSEDNKYYLQLGDFKTTYEVSVVTSTGGIVTSLSVSNVIFLLALCLAAGPLMRLYQYAIPWLKKQFDNIGKLINKW
ncbi:MAG: HAD-IC family P-type ATPase [Acholeplasmatales bacterium]|nr:HAD-IC family P-type ATPase [Acholeplasmatales bacterium]